MSPLRWVLVALTVVVTVVASRAAAELGDTGSVYLWCYAVTCGRIQPGTALTLLAAAATVGSGIVVTALGLYLDRLSERSEGDD